MCRKIGGRNSEKERFGFESIRKRNLNQTNSIIKRQKVIQTTTTLKLNLCLMYIIRKF